MMIPITRKEKYINEIVGGGNTAPEAPQTREELFYAAILGEVVAPSPITRAEKYLAKIANKYSGELPEPVTRIERFLARAAGMDISVPTPVTREEMFWADYALIVEKEISGVPPLTFNAIAGSLKNYRLYGNTETKTRSYSGTAPLSFPINDGEVSNYRIYGNTVNGENVGDLITEGEHAGEYSVPVTVTNGTDTETTNLYLPEQIRKVGDYSDYIDYGSQKFVHRVVRKVFDGTEQFAASERANVIDYFVPVITMGDAGNSINCTSNHISAVSGNKNWANRRVPNAQYVSSFFQNDTNQIRFVWNDNNGVVNLAGLTSQLSTWYANGDPLIVDYIIVEPVEEQVTLPALPALHGTNTLSVGTTVQPSSVAVDVDEIVSCGDRTKNLLQNAATSKTLNDVTFTINEDDSITCNGTASANIDYRLVALNSYSLPAGNYHLTGAPPTASYSSYYLRAWYNSSGPVTGINDFGRGANFTLTDTTTLLCAIIITSQQVLNNVTFYPMIRKADIEDDTYEPYGYKITVTLTADSAETTDIYLDESLVKSGNNADYIDYATQKRYNSDGTESSVTLPEIAVTAGTNALTVGTEVQPSDVYIKYEGAR